MSDFKIGDHVRVTNSSPGFTEDNGFEFIISRLSGDMVYSITISPSGCRKFYRDELSLVDEHQEAMDDISEIEALKDELYNFCQKLENMKAWDVDAVEIVKELGRIWDK